MKKFDSIPHLPSGTFLLLFPFLSLFIFSWPITLCTELHPVASPDKDPLSGLPGWPLNAYLTRSQSMRNLLKPPLRLSCALVIVGALHICFVGNLKSFLQRMLHVLLWLCH